MSTNEPLTEKNDSRKAVASDTSSTASKPPLYIGSEHEYVYSIFRQDGTPIRKMIWTAVVMQLLLIPIVCIMPYPWAGTAKIVFGPQADSFAKALKELPPNLYILLALASPVSFIALLAIPYVPGIILRRHFRDAVIPMCRNTCPGKDIFRGAMRSLRYMLACYVPVLLPGILVYLVPVVFTLGILIKIFCDAQNTGGELVIIHGSFSVIVWMYLLSLPVHAAVRRDPARHVPDPAADLSGADRFHPESRLHGGKNRIPYRRRHCGLHRGFRRRDRVLQPCRKDRRGKMGTEGLRN